MNPNQYESDKGKLNEADLSRAPKAEELSEMDRILSAHKRKRLMEFEPESRLERFE